MDNLLKDHRWPTNSWPDDEDAPIEVDVVAELAAHLAEGQIAVLIESGHEKCNYVDGNAVAVDHAGNRVAIELRDIYDLAAKTFGIPVEQITECAY
jgi:tagatose-1,6-bisphosphate aldolase non-catalytic subunit AgaZ/GatZ